MTVDLSTKSRPYVDMTVIILSAYCNAIMGVVTFQQGLSVCKIILLSFLVKSHEISKTVQYDGRHSNDILTKAVSEAAGEFERLRIELDFILQALILLQKQEWIAIDTDRVNLGASSHVAGRGRLDVFSEKLVRECYEIEDALVLKAVIRNV